MAKVTTVIGDDGQEWLTAEQVGWRLHMPATYARSLMVSGALYSRAALRLHGYPTSCLLGEWRAPEASVDALYLAHVLACIEAQTPSCE